MNTSRPLLQCFGFVTPIRGAIQSRQVFKTRGYIGMVRAERLLGNRQRALEKRLGLRVLALVVVERSEIAQARAYKGMIRAECLLGNRQRALVEWLGPRVLALGVVE